MKVSFNIVSLVTSAITATQACLVLDGTYYTGNNQLIVTLKDNGVQVCSWAGTFTTSSVYLHCIDGHYAWIRQPSWPEHPSWYAAYAYNNNNFHFGVNGKRIISDGGNYDVGTKLDAANYGC